MAEEREKNIGQNPDVTADPGQRAGQNAAEGASGKEKGIEETLEELEALIEKMEDRSSTLEETFSCYERGMKLVKEVSGKIDRVEKKLMILTEDGQNDEV